MGAAAIGAGAFGLLAGSNSHTASYGAIGGATYAPVVRAGHHALVVTSLRTGGTEAVAGLKAGVLNEEQFVEGVSKRDVITDNALRVYAIPTVKKDLPGKLTDHQNEIVSALEAELHRLKEGLTILLNYPNTQNRGDLDSGLQLCIDAMNASRDIQKEAKVEKEAIDERKKDEKARRAQAAEAADGDEE